MKRVHYIDNYLINPQHPVTVNLIGAGGTGSQVLTCLARLDTALRGLGHPGLFITVYDSDIVTEANIGRQLFSPSDIGLNKAQCLVTRMNNFFGNDWKAVPDTHEQLLRQRLEGGTGHLSGSSEGCQTGQSGQHNDYLHGQHKVPSRSVEHTESRAGIGIQKPRDPPVLDGLREYTGHGTGRPRNRTEKNQAAGIQAVRNGGVTEKVITRYVKYARVKEKDSGPSCSLAEALEKQDLFINSTLAQLGCNILWKMFRNGMIHPVENVPQRYDRASRAVPEPLHHESESYRGVIYTPITLLNDKIRNFCLHYCLSQLSDLSFRTANHTFLYFNGIKL